MESNAQSQDISTENGGKHIVEGLMENGSTSVPNGSAPAESKVDYYHPGKGNGSMLDSSGGLGEPLNVIISGQSSSEVLTDAGFLNWAKSIGFSTEFLGLHRGVLQMADLGDGNGPKPEIKVLRQDYSIPFIGTGIESLIGGNHLRYWRQDGPTANSGALFLAVSYEENVLKHHMIRPDGYNKGRDALVTRAVGQTKYKGVRYSTISQVIEGLLPIGTTGINHSIAIDGKGCLLTITILS